MDTQYTDGISGALIIHPSDPAPEGFPTWDEELVVELSDIYHIFSPIITAQYLSVSFLLAFKPCNTHCCFRDPDQYH